MADGRVKREVQKVSAASAAVTLEATMLERVNFKVRSIGACEYECADVYAYACVYVRLHLDLGGECVYMCAYVYVCMCICISMSMCMLMCMCVCIWIWG